MVAVCGIQTTIHLGYGRRFLNAILRLMGATSYENWDPIMCWHFAKLLFVPYDV